MIATERYNFIEKVRNECIERKVGKENISDKLDKIFLNKWLAFPIFAIIMFLVYYLSVGVVGETTVDFINHAIEGLADGTEYSILRMNVSGTLFANTSGLILI